MHIVKSPKYNKQLIRRLKDIAKDSPNNAKKFKKKLDKHIYDLDFIPYLVDEENKKIVILDIFKWEDR